VSASCLPVSLSRQLADLRHIPFQVADRAPCSAGLVLLGLGCDRKLIGTSFRTNSPARALEYVREGNPSRSRPGGNVLLPATWQTVSLGSNRRDFTLDDIERNVRESLKTFYMREPHMAVSGEVRSLPKLNPRDLLCVHTTRFMIRLF
jgi:hypothetical protein